MIRTVRATRYVTPLREGGSLPAIIEADDDGMYVVKFRGAGQGPLALVAELVVGEIGRALGLPVPEIVFVALDAALGRNEPDYEIRQLLQASAGLNLALDYLPGSVMFDPAAGDKADARVASETVWLDAFTMNVDRTPRNPNLLVWHKALYLIDHGAALYFHHNWDSRERLAESPFKGIREHVLLPWAGELEGVAARMAAGVSRDLLAAVLGAVPEEWSAAERREGYIEFFTRRIAASHIFVEEALRARAELV